MNDPITIRVSRPADEPALWALAALDSARLPARPLVVAEQDGLLRAAVGLDSGEAIADPFHVTAELIDLLELRVEQLRRRASEGSGVPVRGRTRLVAHAAGT